MPYDGKRGRPDGSETAFPAQGNIQRIGPSTVQGAVDLLEDETVDCHSGNGRLSIAGYDLGEAKLFATTRRVIFMMSDNSGGFQLPYQCVRLHAVGTDPEHFARPTLLMHTEPAIATYDELTEEQHAPTATSEVVGGPGVARRRAEDGSVLTGVDLLRAEEILFVPEDSSKLDELYDSLGRCAAMNPAEGEEDEGSFAGLLAMAAGGGGFYTGESDNVEMNGAAAQAAADIEAMLPSVEPEDEDQFDDAENDD